MRIHAIRLACCCALVSPLGLGCTSQVDNGSDSDDSTPTEGTATSMPDTETSTTTTMVSPTSPSSSSSGTSATSSSSTSTTGTATEEGSTAEASTGEPGGCDPFPSEGTPCPVDGEFCSSDCSDQCQFCNVLACEAGVWSRMEVFPADCLECAALCDLVVAPDCEAGPPDIDLCVAGCELELAGDCVAEFSQARACAGSKPTFVCSDVDQPEAVGCEAQFDGYYACMAG